MPAADTTRVNNCSFADAPSSLFATFPRSTGSVSVVQYWLWENGDWFVFDPGRPCTDHFSFLVQKLDQCIVTIRYGVEMPRPWASDWLIRSGADPRVTLEWPLIGQVVILTNRINWTSSRRVCIIAVFALLGQSPNLVMIFSVLTSVCLGKK